MAVNFTLDKDYGYVLAAAAASFGVTIWHGIRVTPFRRAAGVPYPIPYAYGPSTVQEKSAATPEKKKAEYLFNCAQRSHANYLENYPVFLPAMLLGGLKYPLTAAGLGAFWLVNRILYSIGYTRPDKERGSGRTIGLLYIPAQALLALLSGKVAYDVIMA